MEIRDAFITGVGSFSPGEAVPFDNIEDVLGKITNATPKVMKRIERIRPLMKKMLGIEYSHYAIDPATREATEDNVSMAKKAAIPALEQAGIQASDVDLILNAGILYDYMCPPTSVFLQEALGIDYCAEIEIHSNCTSIYKALQVASDMVAVGRYDTVLVTASQLSSAFLRAEYYNQEQLTQEQAILRWFLCDGAAAFVVSSQPTDSLSLRIHRTYLESVGIGIEPSMRMLVGSKYADLKDIYARGLHHLVQDFDVVSKIGPELFRKGFHEMMKGETLDISRVKCFFANIPTKHLMDLAVKKLRKIDFNADLPFYSKLATRGYQGAPAVFIGIDDYLSETALKSGDILVSFVTESSKWMHAGFILECV